MGYGVLFGKLCSVKALPSGIEYKFAAGSYLIGPDCVNTFK